jgi:hypothetical protein
MIRARIITGWLALLSYVAGRGSSRVLGVKHLLYMSKVLVCLVHVIEQVLVAKPVWL